VTGESAIISAKLEEAEAARRSNASGKTAFIVVCIPVLGMVKKDVGVVEGLSGGA